VGVHATVDDGDRVYGTSTVEGLTSSIYEAAGEPMTGTIDKR
jgi:hypothetical protein